MDGLAFNAPSAARERLLSRFSSQEMKMKIVDANIGKHMNIIRTHKKAVIALRTQRNEYAPISSLPVEIMTKIFFHVKELDHIYNSWYPRLRWINVSHVCTLWRNIAINCPGLWTKPPFRRRLWAKEMIKRAKNSALDITVDFDANFRSMNVVKGISWPSRGEYLRELILYNAQNSRWHWFWEVAPTNLPRLEKLWVNGGDTQVFMPMPIFSGANKLREVSLRLCKMDWFLYLPPSITTLQLDDVETVSPSTFLQLITALGSLHSLEVLKLKDSLKFFQIDGSRSRQVALPKLRVLSIHSSLDEAASLFRSITIPSTVPLVLNILGERSTASCIETIKEMFTAIGQSYIHRTPELPLQTLKIWSQNFSGGFISLRFPGPDDTKFPKDLSISIYFESKGSTGPNDFLSAIFQSGFPMQDVNAASIKGLGKRFTASTLAATLGGLPNLTRIDTDSISARVLVKAIGLIDPSAKKVHFSNLSVLELNGVHFESRLHSRNSLMPGFTNSLLLRRQYNAELSELILTDCRQLNENIVKQLREVVVGVDWDGVTGSLYTEDECDTSDCSEHI